MDGGRAVAGGRHLDRRARHRTVFTPDGNRLGFVAQHGETTAVYLRPVDGFEAAHVPGTEGAVSLFFSPDGEWIGFYGGGA
jgi:hypothetical protein